MRYYSKPGSMIEVDAEPETIGDYAAIGAAAAGIPYNRHSQGLDIPRSLTEPGPVDGTLQARGGRYGKFNGVAQITQALKAEMRATPNWDSLSFDKKEALEMIAQKIARILNGDPSYHDSWHDIAGYAELVASALQGVQK